MKEQQPSSQLLKKAGLKVTRQRTAILDILLAADGSLTADELYLMLKKQGHRLGLSTVYRTLSSLEEYGLIPRAGLPGSSQRFFPKAAGHRHQLICTQCRASVELDRCPLGEFSTEMGDRYGFAITGHALEIFGLCPKCQEKGREDV